MRQYVLTVILLPACATACIAASHSAGAKPIDVAECFRQIDAELSAYDSGSAALHKVMAPTSGRMARANTAHLWQQPAALLQQHAINIRAVARKYRLASGNLKTRSASAIFAGLESAAARVALTAQQLQATRRRAAALQLERRLDSETVALVRRFEKLVAGFPALKCGDQESPCCASRPIREGQDRFQGCRWVCIKEARKCTSGLCGYSQRGAPEPSQ
jgi:hypothetical protein